MTDLENLSALEKSVANAGSQLYSVAHKLHRVEQNLDNVQGLDDMDEMCVLELLESMSEVKTEYQNLRKDICEVQQLQRDVTTSIRFQMRNMHSTFHMLKKRLENNTKGKRRNEVATTYH